MLRARSRRGGRSSKGEADRAAGFPRCVDGEWVRGSAADRRSRSVARGGRERADRHARGGTAGHRRPSARSTSPISVGRSRAASRSRDSRCSYARPEAICSLEGARCLHHARCGDARRRRGGEVFHHAIFRARGEGYPSTLMGNPRSAPAVLPRRASSDRCASSASRRTAGLASAWDPDLRGSARAPRQRGATGGGGPTAERHRALDRARRRSSSCIAIAGSRESWKLRADSRAARSPVFLALDWGEEVVDPAAEKKKQEEELKKKERAKKEEPPPAPGAGLGGASVAGTEPEHRKRSRRARRRRPRRRPPPPRKGSGRGQAFRVRGTRSGAHGEGATSGGESRDCAKRLQEAGVAYAFCTGQGIRAILMKNVRTLVERLHRGRGSRPR